MSGLLELKLDYNEGKIRAELSSLDSIPGAQRKALARAINKALNGTRTDIVADLRSRTVLRAGTIRKGITVAACRWQSASRLSGAVKVDTKRLPLTEYKVSPLRITAQKGRLPSKYKAVSYRLGRGGKSFGNAPQVETRSKLFVAMVRGRLGVFARPGAERGKLIQETGPSLQAFYGNSVRQDAIMASADLRFRKELAHQINHLAGGGR